MRTRICLLAVLLALLVSPSEASRLRTVGFEINSLKSQFLDGTDTFAGSVPTIDTSTFRSGARSAKCNSGAGNATSFVGIILKTAEQPAVGTAVFLRAYMNFSSLPTSGTTQLVSIENTASSKLVSARLTTAGKLQLWNDQANAQVGSDSATALTTGTWYRIEVSYTSSSTSGTQKAELQLDGVSVASSSTLSILVSAAPSQFFVGWFSAPGANLVCNVDDYALNTSSGSAQNSWPGSGKVVLLKPASDNARTGWVTGGGATTSLFAAVDNTPPIGSATETNTSNIKDTVSSTTDNYDTNLSTYSSAGIGAADTIRLVQAVIDQGQQSTTGTKTGAVLVVSNPAQSAEDTFTYGTLNGTAIGTWPTGWDGVWGTAQTSPTVTVGTAPVVRVGKRTATTREVDADFMGLYVEYIPAAVTAAPRLPLLGVGNP